MYPNNSPYPPQNQPDNQPSQGGYPPQPPVYSESGFSSGDSSGQFSMPQDNYTQPYYPPQQSGYPPQNQSAPYPYQQSAPGFQSNYSPLPPASTSLSSGSRVPVPPPRAKRYDKLPLPIRIVDWFKKNWWAPVIGIFILVIAGDIVYQMAYPVDALPPGVSIDGIKAGQSSRAEIIEKLNSEYSKVPVEIYFGSSTSAYKVSPAKEVGIIVDNNDRLKNAGYPLWLRLIPTSLWWAANLSKIDGPIYKYDKSTLDKYTLKELGADCKIQPKNASLKLEDNQFVVVKAVSGGTCNATNFAAEVQKARIGNNGKITVRSDIEEVTADISDDKAKALADKLNNILSREFTIKAGDNVTKVPGNTIKGWLVFKAIVPKEGEKGESSLKAEVEKDRLNRYLQSNVASRVEKKPGVTTITTKDFTLISQVNGASGVLIDIDATIASVDKILAGEGSEIIVSTKNVGPEVRYNRSYSPNDTGLKALIEHFSNDNPGQIGIVFREDRKGSIPISVNDKLQLPSLGFEGLYLAYLALAGIEDKSLQPTDKVSGNSSISDCITESITEQNKDCINGLLSKIGYDAANAKLKSIGLTDTVLTGEGSKTTAHDMSLFIQKLTSNQLGLKQRASSIESAMRNNKYRDGMIRVGGGAYSAVGVSDSGYVEQVILNNKTRFTVAYISDNKDPKQAQKLISAINKLITEKNNKR